MNFKTLFLIIKEIRRARFMSGFFDDALNTGEIGHSSPEQKARYDAAHTQAGKLRFDEGMKYSMNPKTLLLINEEIRRAKSLHPRSMPGCVSPERSFAIFTEEFLEAVEHMLRLNRAMLDSTRPSIDASARAIIRKEMVVELTQTAAMACLWLENELEHNWEAKPRG